MTFDASRIPIWLQRTPEQQSADDALQSRLKQAYGPVHPSRTERHLMRADMIERSASAILSHLNTADAPQHQLDSAKGQLAEAWAMKGRYREAAAIHPSRAHAKHFNAIAEAIERDDAESCSCDPIRTTEPQTSKTITLEPLNIDEMVYSQRHNKLMPLLSCRCGFKNVKHAPAHMERRLANLKKRE